MRRTVVILIFICLRIIAIAQSPNFQWAKKIGGDNGETGQAVAVDALGNVYSTGIFEGPTDFDPGPGTFTLNSAGNSDVFISKFDASGNFVWAKRIGGNAFDFSSDICLDAFGNILIVGSFQDSSDFDPGPGTFLLGATNVYRDIFICKLNGSGNFIWAKKIGGTNTDEGNGITTDGSGNVYTTGYFVGTVDFDPGPSTFNLNGGGMFISKLDAAGNFVWAKFGGATNGFKITLDATGNVFTTGTFQLATDFDPGVGTFTLNSAAGSQDAFVLKLDPSGNFVWVSSLGGTSTDMGRGIKTDMLGNIYTTGSFQGTGDFDPGNGAYNLTSAGSQDIFISKLDPAGNFVWAKQLGGPSSDVANGIALDVLGNVYTTGYFSNTSDFDPGLSTFYLTTPGNEKVFISKLDVNGNFVWAGQIGGNLNAVSYGITVDTFGSVLTTGAFMDASDFDPGPGTYTLVPFGSFPIYDAFIQKMCQTPVMQGTINGSTIVCLGVASNYIINPIAFASSYQWNLPVGWTGSGTTNTLFATAGSSGVFSVSAFNSCGFTSIQTLSVTVLPAPTVTVNSGSICSGNNFTIVPGGANSYTISGGLTVVSPTSNSNYTVTGVNTQSCTNSAISTITVNALPTVSITSSSSLICIGQNATLTPSGAITYTWNNASTASQIVVSPTVITSYTVNGTDANGCGNFFSIIQNVGLCTGLNNFNVSDLMDVEIYPNPGFDFLNINMNLNQPDENFIEILNVLGEIVYRSQILNKQTSINIAQLKSGLYYVKIINNNTIVTNTKIIKN